MGSSWIEKEEEYRKVNEELQEKNKMLMEEFDSVLRKHNNLLQESTKSKTNRNSFVQNQVKYFDASSKENLPNEENEVVGVPDSVDEMGVKAMARFYKAKIKAMQNYENKLQTDLKLKIDEIKKLQKENSKLSESKEKIFQAYNSSKHSVNKLEQEISGLNAKCQCKENENSVLKKDIEQLKKEFKNTNLNVTGNEIRLNRALEENEKIKISLKSSKQVEKELKDLHKKEINELNGVIKLLEKQKGEILNAFKQQMRVIENLKQQNLYIEALKVNQISESEFRTKKLKDRIYSKK